MIQNKISSEEFDKILRPILRLDKIEDIKHNVYKILHFQKATTNENAQYIINTKFTGINSTYKGFEIEIRRLPDQKNGYTGLIFQLRKKKTFADFIFDPKARILKQIKNICAEEVSGGQFNDFNPRDLTSPNVIEKFLYQRNAKYPEWEKGNKLSPLALFIKADSKEHLIELLFHPECYERMSNKTILSEDWIQIFSQGPSW